MTDAYYELADPHDPPGETFSASNHVISTWSPTTQNAPPEGGWIGIRAENHYGRDGVGVSIATLFDEHGAVAALRQAQLVRRR